MISLTHPEAAPSRTRLRSSALAIVSVAGLVALGVGVLAPRSALAAPDIPAGAHFTSWADNGKAADDGKSGERVLQLVQGDLPKGTGIVAGVVKTDTACDEDDASLNHCHNVIALAGGGEIEVVLNHKNSRTLCLSPGDRLTLARLGGGWLVAKED